MRPESARFGFTAGGSDGLFFALLPDAGAAARLRTIAAQQCIRHRLAGRPLSGQRFYVSLLGFRAPQPEVVASMKRAGDALALPPFEVTFDRAVSFLGRPRPRVLCGDNVELIAFERALGRAMERHELGRVKRQFTPHVTLLYDERAVDEDAIEPIRWTVTEFVLVRSRRGHGEHVTLARWPLRVQLPAAS
jgi:2'-5' RNA ligase